MDSRLFIVGVLLALTRIASCVPAATSMNQQPIQSNVLSSGNEHLNQAQQSQAAPSEQAIGQLVYRSAPTTNSNNQPTYVTGYTAQPAAYPRESQLSLPSSSPFFGLSSNGDFQLSAYFSQIFWTFTALVVGVAVIIWLIRVFYPSESLGGIVQKIKESGTARSLDLDRLTNIVYGAIDTYEKWAAKESRAFARAENSKTR